MTIRYSGPGALMGIPTIFNQSSPGADGSTWALVESRVVQFQPPVVRSRAERDVRFANAMLAETSQRAAEFIDELEASSFASLRQRLARHLLDLAAEHQMGPRLVARMSIVPQHDALAEAAGVDSFSGSRVSDGRQHLVELPAQLVSTRCQSSWCAGASKYPSTDMDS